MTLNYGSSAIVKVLGSSSGGKKHKKGVGRAADQKTETVVTIVYIRGEVFEPQDSNGLADPYIRIGTVKSEGVFSKKWKSESPVCEKTLSPNWNNYEDEFIMKQTTKELVVELWDKDTLKDDFVGRTIIDISKIVTSFSTFEIKFKEKPTDEKPKGSANILIKKLY
ncbi:hypothetical protein ACTFIZ_004323 [Dictyostelium cf. discoideum]